MSANDFIANYFLALAVACLFWLALRSEPRDKPSPRFWL